MRQPVFDAAARWDTTDPVAEWVAGQSGLIPWFATMPPLTYSASNARIKGLSQNAAYKDPWRYGKRVIIPALSFEGPCWEIGRNVWRRFWRVDAKAWRLAGL